MHWKASNQLVMSSTCHLSFFGVDVSTSRPSNRNWGLGSFNSSFNSTNSLAMIWFTSFAGTGEKPGPSANSWCKIGVWVTKEIPPRLSRTVMANVETNAGRTKSGLPWTMEVVAVGVTDEKSTPEAARTEAWAVNWPEHPEAWPSSASSWQN